LAVDTAESVLAEAFTAMRLVVVAAHPDDETIGAAMLLRRLTRCGVTVLVVHVTDGAPRDMRDARMAGFATVEAYARARRHELADAFQTGSIPVERWEMLGIPDQRASYVLPEVVAALTALFQRERPDAVLTHAYEGGHPDHDATALAVTVAWRNAQLAPNSHCEMSSYHLAGDACRTACFLPAADVQPVVIPLTPDEQALKRAMIACFRTQQRVLRQFGVDVEVVRRAPTYDFSRPPHEGRLYYERFDWGIDGPTWRARAQEALQRADAYR
jgi:N-acetylglucosamine malate deacetylase 2